MRAKVGIALTVVGIFAASYAVKLLLIPYAGDVRPSPESPATEEDPTAPAEPPQRIVSMAPGVTETLYALNLQEKIVGVTRYCDYPAAAANKPKVGGLLDPNYESVLVARPDLVIVYPEHVQEVNHFVRLGLRTLVVEHDSLADIFDSIRDISRACGVSPRGESLVARMEARIARVARMTQSLPRPRVLVCIDREIGSGTIKNAYVAGMGGLYEELLNKAGAENAYHGAPLQFPKLSAEGILQLDPDVILDLVGGLQASGLDPQEVQHDWDALPNVRAVADGRVHVVAANDLVRPGPRIAGAVEALARTIHPQLGWQESAP